MPHSPVKISNQQPGTLTLGLNHLWQIKFNQLGFYDRLEKQYGDVVRLRLGPYRTWILFHPDPIEALLTRHSENFIRFRKLTDVVRQWNGDSLLLAEGEAWHVRRRKVMPAFKTKRLPNYGEAAIDHAKRLCSKMDLDAKSGEDIELDTDAVMARLTLDIATTTLFGSEPLDNGDEIEAAIQVLSTTAFRETTSPLVLPDWLPLKAKRLKKWAMTVMDDMVTGLVKDRLDDIKAGGDKDRGDLLSMLVEHHQGHAVDIRNDSMSLLIAGHETSGALLSWVFALLAQHPNILAKLNAELGTILSGRKAHFSDLRDLSYLRAVIEESLRLYPPAYALFVRQALTDIDLAGVKVKAGDNVQIVPYTLHRSERWYQDASTFKPERFLEDTTWPKYSYLPFGAGPRVCIGQNFGLMEACLVVATILQHWQPRAVNGDLVPDAKFSLRPKGGLSMIWTKHKVSGKLQA